MPNYFSANRPPFSWLSRPGPSSLAVILGVAAAYYAFGRLGLLFTVPPGYSTAIWPASGLALAATLGWGWPAYPGILIGSTLVNLQVGLASAGEWNLRVMDRVRRRKNPRSIFR